MTRVKKRVSLWIKENLGFCGGVAFALVLMFNAIKGEAPPRMQDILNIQERAIRRDGDGPTSEGPEDQQASSAYVEDAFVLAAALSTECYPNDTMCADMVYNVMSWRSRLSERSITDSIMVPDQLSGLDKKITPRKLLSSSSSWFEYSISLLNGAIDISYLPRSTHYARREVVFKTTFGKEGLRQRCTFYMFPDGHVMIGDTASGDYLKFRTK